MIDEKLLEKLQRLGSIELSSEQKQKAIKNLNDIVDFVENINKLDLDSTPVSFNPLSASLPMREDIIQNDSTIAQKTLKNAPKTEENFFIVPKIIE